MDPKPGKFLSEIIAARLKSMREAQAQVPLKQIQEEAKKRTERRDFTGALSARGVNIIAELKKNSPSKGNLRKDFILDEYQIYESIAAGADALLLIVSALSKKKLGHLTRLCQNLQIEPLVEIHSENELEMAHGAGATLIGVNNRHLGTFEVSLTTSLRLIERIPHNYVAVSESGISSGLEVARLKRAGFSAVLVGEQFMTAHEPGLELKTMLRSAHEELTKS